MLRIKVVFRTDGGPDIGMGHIMRCISLANEIKNSGHEVFFICKMPEGANKARESGFHTVVMDSDLGNSERSALGSEAVEESNYVVSIIENANIDVFIVDSYQFDSSYFLAIKPHVKKLAYIDDLNRFEYPVDIVVNGNITADFIDTQAVSLDILLLMGVKYNLVRSEFRDIIKKRTKRKVSDIMITTGASDPYDSAYGIVAALCKYTKFREINLHIVVGGAFQNVDKLDKLQAANNNIILHKNISSMSEIMILSDIAITAGGSTMYELCACGTPSLVIILSDVQIEITNKMCELGYMELLGRYDSISDELLIHSVSNLCDDYERRCSVSEAMQKLVDGLGTLRVVKAIESIA